VEAPNRPPIRRTLTPAVLLAAAFLVGCAGVSIAFVAAHGGLEVPAIAGASGGVAVASPSLAPVPSEAPATAVPSPSEPRPTPTPAVPTEAPVPTPPAVASPTPAASLDSLAVLPGCPDHPGCYLYTVRRGDTLGTISDRWAIGLWIVEALNPEIRNPSTIVPGQVIYLGRSPVVRLDPCPDASGCYLYVVRSGDRLSTIAGRYGTTTSAILALNPEIEDANSIHTGQTIRIPGPVIG
jgi:nucleoid-associated protein YgaU